MHTPKSVTAQSNLGMMYLQGRGGLVKSYEKAVEWFQKAADKGQLIAANQIVTV